LIALNIQGDIKKRASKALASDKIPTKKREIDEIPLLSVPFEENKSIDKPASKKRKTEPPIPPHHHHPSFLLFNHLSFSKFQKLLNVMYCPTTHPSYQQYITRNNTCHLYNAHMIEIHVHPDRFMMV